MTGFKDVVGRKDLVSYIQKAITQNQISHAYILNGERGSGKKMFAQLFAMTLQCERGGAEPCNECHPAVRLYLEIIRILSGWFTKSRIRSAWMRYVYRLIMKYDPALQWKI